MEVQCKSGSRWQQHQQAGGGGGRAGAAGAVVAAAATDMGDLLQPPRKRLRLRSRSSAAGVFPHAPSASKPRLSHSILGRSLPCWKGLLSREKHPNTMTDVINVGDHDGGGGGDYGDDGCRVFRTQHLK